MELFNPDCQLIHFVTNLKLRCGLDSTEQVELMDSSGTLVKLEGRERSLSRASALLTGRRSYMLLRVCSVPEAKPRCRTRTVSSTNMTFE
uniref:Uncharacterized protein n=1 Tax=Knipowitschia caucasica TaxID=637954 RepID=A0AAV2MT35_KNICA